MSVTFLQKYRSRRIASEAKTEDLLYEIRSRALGWLHGHVPRPIARFRRYIDEHELRVMRASMSKRWKAREKALDYWSAHGLLRYRRDLATIARARREAA